MNKLQEQALCARCNFNNVDELKIPVPALPSEDDARDTESPEHFFIYSDYSQLFFSDLISKEQFSVIKHQPELCRPLQG